VSKTAGNSWRNNEKLVKIEMQLNRFESCEENLKILDSVGERFLENVITQDETPLSLYIPESKRESLEWKLPNESSTKK
jgi:hypothetical protein